MKQIPILSILLFVFGFSSIGKQRRNFCSDNSIIKNDKLTSRDSLVYLKKLALKGDFDGDGLLDTINQNVVNVNTKQQIDYFPSRQWDSIENYFDRIGAEVILTLKNRKCDTLHLGSGGGLYCLINIGDTNKDKKDEVAFVVNNYGFTNISLCTVYTLCGTEWNELKSFQIHESAFDYEGKNIPDFIQIKGFLEFRKNKWFFIDYKDWFNAESDKDTILKPLKIKKGC